MTAWRMLLRELDARDEDERLSPDDAESIRRAMLTAAAKATPERERGLWMKPLLVAATVVVMVAVGVLAGRRFDLPVPPQNPPAQAESTADSPAAAISEPNRQLQFLTPGGTRIIWVFNSDFDVKATVR
jgi:hypothetical protein